jgi:hypothetical protein
VCDPPLDPESRELDWPTDFMKKCVPGDLVQRLKCKMKQHY